MSRLDFCTLHCSSFWPFKRYDYFACWKTTLQVEISYHEKSVIVAKDFVKKSLKSARVKSGVSGQLSLEEEHWRHHHLCPVIWYQCHLSSFRELKRNSRVWKATTWRHISSTMHYTRASKSSRKSRLFANRTLYCDVWPLVYQKWMELRCFEVERGRTHHGKQKKGGQKTNKETSIPLIESRSNNSIQNIRAAGSFYNEKLTQ